MHPVRAKKHLGQHFLNDTNIAQQIAQSLTGQGGYDTIIEIGPGTGVLSQFLYELYPEKNIILLDIDTESIAYLHQKYPNYKTTILEADFLNIDLNSLTNQQPVAIIGNFPYNISSQILFKIYENRDFVPEASGMFQKEVAQRIAAPPGNKEYGILSVLLQAFYDIEYLFTVPPDVFTPPPKVDSGVIRLKRNTTATLPCNEAFFKRCVKAGFNQRRKTLSNALKANSLTAPPIYASKRAEQLSVEEWIDLVCIIEKLK